MSEIEPHVTLAAVVGAHGIAGEVRLKLFTGELARYPVLHAGARALTVKSLRPGPNGAVARFAEVTDRTAAEALRGTALSVPRAALPPLAEGEYYHADLIGRDALSSDGAALGHVVAVENYGAGDLIEIERADGRRFLVPVGAGVDDLGPPIRVHAAFVDA
ncbi:MAG TPA: ribosome maturation factor RimM [Sphingomonas sp.]